MDVTIQEVTRGTVLREFRRLCDLIDQAERHEYINVDKEPTIGLIGMDDAIRMRDTYRDRADVVLDALKMREKVRS